MTTHTTQHAHRGPDDGAEQCSHAELLITRLIDHEASSEDRIAFEALASAEPSLWQLLARRLEDTALLRGALDDATAAAAMKELNVLVEAHGHRSNMNGGSTTSTRGVSGSTRQHRAHSSLNDGLNESPTHTWNASTENNTGSGMRWAMSMVGWAAAIVIAMVWWLGDSGAGLRESIQQVPVQVAHAEVHYEHYLEAPFVLNESPPTLESLEELADGRVVIEFVRCIEEVIFFDSINELPESMESFSPAEFRRALQSLRGGAAEGDAEDHFSQYLRAPYVIGEYQPTLLEVKELKDGRIVLRYLRRIGEVAVFDSASEVPISADGSLQFSPSDFRRDRMHEPVS